MTRPYLTEVQIAALRRTCRKALDPQRVGKRRAEAVAQYVKALESLVEGTMPYVWAEIARRSE